MALIVSGPFYAVKVNVTLGGANTTSEARSYLKVVERMLKQDHLLPKTVAVAGGQEEPFGTCVITGSPTAPPSAQCGLTAAQVHRLQMISPEPTLRAVTKEPSPLHAAVFWLLAGTVGYLLSAGFYLRRARRRGVATSPRAYLLTGVGLLVAVAVTAAGGVFPLGHLLERQLVPLATIGVGLLVLARAERSWALALIGVTFLAALFLSSGYVSPTSGHGLAFAFAAELTPWRIALLGAWLLAAGGAFALREHPRERLR
jgi:hypothetical protein